MAAYLVGFTALLTSRHNAVFGSPAARSCISAILGSRNSPSSYEGCLGFDDFLGILTV